MSEKERVMQEVSREEAIKEFGSHVRVYLNPQFIRHMCLEDTRQGYRHWFKCYEDQAQQGKVTIIESLGLDSLDDRNKSHLQYLLQRQAESAFNDHELVSSPNSFKDAYEYDLREFLGGLYEGWKNENIGAFARAVSWYPKSSEVMDKIALDVQPLPETLIIPDKENILGVGSQITRKSPVSGGRDSVYRVKNATVFMVDNQIQILYEIRRQKMIARCWKDDSMTVNDSVTANDLKNILLIFVFRLNQSTLNAQWEEK